VAQLLLDLSNALAQVVHADEVTRNEVCRGHPRVLIRRARPGGAGHNHRGSRGGFVTEFCISIAHTDAGSTVQCEGELDLFTSSRLQEALEVCLEREPKALHIDARKVTLLTTAGIKLLVDAAVRCHDAAIGFTLSASGHARRVLDLVGLWWLGVVDDGVRMQSAMKEALAAYASLRFDGRLGEDEPG
jgi:anti-anti-sigma factor